MRSIINDIMMYFRSICMILIVCLQSVFQLFIEVFGVYNWNWRDYTHVIETRENKSSQLLRTFFLDGQITHNL